METLIHALRNLGPVRLAIMGAIILGMIGFFIFLAARLATPSMVLLYGDLNADDSSRITSQLSSQNIPFELSQGGSQIMVPSDRVLKLRLGLASQGLPSGGSIGYGLLDEQQSTGTPGFVQNINLVRALEGELARTIESLLEKTVGFGKVRAEVKADMDFDRISTTDEKFDPDGQVVKSAQTIEETNQTRDPNAASGESAASSAAQTRTEETVNFEVSKKIINHVREVGILNRLSVMVLVDGVRGLDDNDDPTYQPRGEDEMELLAVLVRGAIGFNADRGDIVEVINMEFAEVADEEPPLELFLGLEKNDLLRMVEVLVLGIVAILVILLVVRPLVSWAFESIPSAAALAARGIPSEATVEEEQSEELIDIDRVEGRVKASSVKKVGEIVEKHPEEALSIMRAWMYQKG